MYMEVKNWKDYSKKRVIIPQLFGPFLCEGDVSLLFGPTYVGKSVLAVQLTNQISYGLNCMELTNGLNGKGGLKSLYFDFELSEQQFLKRYTDGNNVHLSPNFHRTDKSCFELTEDTNIMSGILEDHKDNLLVSFVKNLETLVRDDGFKFIVFDNMMMFSKIVGLKDSTKMVRVFKYLSEQYGVTTLIVAHTKKLSGREPVQIDHLYGDSRFGNTVDSSFVINRSMTQPGLFYLKQIKSRQDKIEYHENNVLQLEIDKLEVNNRLQFKRCGRPTLEETHLMDNRTRREERDMKILLEIRQVRRSHSRHISYNKLSDLMKIGKSKLFRLEDNEKLLKLVRKLEQEEENEEFDDFEEFEENEEFDD